ncbi:DUF1990 domain-containing protein [Streptomyces sp. NPDC006296]|uniref:DUF1990 family protein n=1 Tax=Streptomyces sp. NPDC006296 TaxID=3156746 RepID=UPI0033B784B0
MNTLTYPEVGATRLGPLPEGYHHLRHRAAVGRGRAAFEAAGAAVTEWRVHRASGVHVDASAARAAAGVAVEMWAGVGRARVTASCEVVWAMYEDTRTGFAYGTRTRHPECGEESFVVELADDGTVWFTVTAFSRPACWYARLAGPLVPLAQRLYARRLGRTLRRAVSEP